MPSASAMMVSVHSPCNQTARSWPAVGWIQQPATAKTSCSVRLLDDGSGDSTFGVYHSYVTSDFDGGDDFLRGLAIDDEGKIVAAGSAWVVRDDDFAVARYEGGQYNYRGYAYGVGEFIQAEDFDNGGEGISYHDDGTWINTFGQYRRHGRGYRLQPIGGLAPFDARIRWTSPLPDGQYFVRVKAGAVHDAFGNANPRRSTVGSSTYSPAIRIATSA